jgi:iron-sulfur cluster repair protein YtfE (RIC family)
MKRLFLASLSTIALAATFALPASALNERFDDARDATINQLNDRFDDARDATINQLNDRFDEEHQDTLNQLIPAPNKTLLLVNRNPFQRRRNSPQPHQTPRDVISTLEELLQQMLSGR